MAFVHGAAFGLLPVGWTIFNAMLLYNITVETGQFDIVRRSVAGLSGDARIQAILIGFAFGAFLEGAAGGGTPVAICGAIMVGLGFDPFLAAVLCLIANTSPVAYGGLGTPLITLTGVTDLPTETLSVMAGHQLPLLSLFVPLYMVKVHVHAGGRRWEVWPALLVAGGSFAVFQFTFATIHAYVPGLVLYPMTDIGGGIFSLVVTAVFLQFWKPRKEWHFDKPATATPAPAGRRMPARRSARRRGGGAARPGKPADRTRPPLTLAQRQPGLGAVRPHVGAAAADRPGPPERKDRHGPVRVRPAADQLHDPGPRPAPAVAPRPAPARRSRADRRRPWSWPARQPSDAPPTERWPPSRSAEAGDGRVQFRLADRPRHGRLPRRPAVDAHAAHGPPRRSAGCSGATCRPDEDPDPDDLPSCSGLSYVTRYAGMDATLGIAFASTGVAVPFFAAMLGWLGVFLTGTDAGSNALFGSLQKITATAGLQQRASSRQPRRWAGPGADLHRQQHRRRHGQDDRRPEHLRGHGGDATSSARRPTSSRRSSGTASSWRRSSA